MQQIQPFTLYDAVTRLYYELTEIEADHDELTDTQVREALTEALWQGFVQPVPGYELPETFYMFTAAANEAVRRALAGFLECCGHVYPDELGPGDRADLLETVGDYIAAPAHLTVKSALKRTYIQHGRAWYNARSTAMKDVVDDVHLEVRDGDQKLGTVHIEWINLYSLVVPRLVAFDDSWAALAAMPDVIAALGQRHNQNLNPIALCEILKSLGFEDVTPVNPS